MSDQDDNQKNDGSPRTFDPTVDPVTPPASSVPNPFARPATPPANPFTQTPGSPVSNPFAKPAAPSFGKLPEPAPVEEAAAVEEVPSYSAPHAPAPHAPVEEAAEEPAQEFAPRSYDAPVEEPAQEFAPHSYEAPVEEAAPQFSSAAYDAPRSEEPASYLPQPESYASAPEHQFTVAEEEELPAPATAEMPVMMSPAGDRLKELRNELASQGKVAKPRGKASLVGAALILLSVAGAGVFFLLSGEKEQPAAVPVAAAVVAQPETIPADEMAVPVTTPAVAEPGSAASLCDAAITATNQANGQCSINDIAVPCDAYMRYQEQGFFDFCAAASRNGAQGAAVQMRQTEQQQAAEQQKATTAQKTAWDLCGQAITKFDKQGEHCLLNDVVVPCQHYDYYQAHPTTPFYCGEKK